MISVVANETDGGKRPRSVWRRGTLRQSKVHRAVALVESIAVATISLVIYLLLLEMIVRVVIGAPIIGLKDFRSSHAAKVTLNRFVEYDRLLGWHIKPFLDASELDMHTLEYGFRSNGGDAAAVKKGGLLAVGSSFTAGSEVADDETWPAHLSQMTGWNVNNAGQGNYLADQIIMNGERLLPIIRPKILVVDFLPENITGAAYSSYAWPKPYFTVVKGELIQHNFPVPRTIDEGNVDRWQLKQFLGNFVLADRFMGAFFPDVWFTFKSSAYITVDTDPIDVTCRLLKRLKLQTAEAKTVLVLYLQFGGGNIKATAEPPPSVRVADCARDADILVVDEYQFLRAEYEKDPALLNKVYHVTNSGSFGHKTSFGNMLVARTLNGALEKAKVAATVQ